MLKRMFLVCSFTLLSCTAFAAGRSESADPADSRRAAAPRLEAAKPNVASNLEGYTVRTAAHWPGYTRDSIVGRSVLDAWAGVEKELDVTFKWVQMPNPSTTIEKLTATVLLGEPFADIVWVRPAEAIPALVQANMILPLDDYIDFSDPRWPHQNRQIAEFKGRMYGLVPWMLSGGQGIWYNRSLFQREGFPDLHELQKRGEWTWDAYMEIARAATRDTDGDGQMDQWGVTVGYEIEYPLIYANGARIVKMGADGTYRFCLDEPAAIEALDFIGRVYRSGVLTYDGEAAFISGRAAMYGGAVFQGHTMLASMQDEYGFVYYPKGPSVKEYQSVSSSADVEMMVIPANVNYPPERLGRIITRTTPFAAMDRVRMEFLQGQFRLKEDMDQVLQMIARTQFTRTDSFPGLRRVTGQIFREIRKGSSAASAVAQFTRPAQSAIDATFR